MKRTGDAAAESGAKRARADEDDDFVVYQPNVVAKMDQQVDVVIPAKYLVSEHKNVRTRNLWGTDVYTDESDLVAVLAHTGHVALKAAAPKTPLLVTLRAADPQAVYPSTERNGVKSREWKEVHEGGCYKVERCIQWTGGELPPPQLSHLVPESDRSIPGSIIELPEGPGGAFTIPNACTVVFSLSNEPFLKYSLALVADQGMTPDRFTSARLRKEALFLESHSTRWELSRTHQEGRDDRYALSRVLKPQEMDRKATLAAGVPLPKTAVEVVYKDLDWEELVWGPSFVRVRGKEFPLARGLYVPHTVG